MNILIAFILYTIYLHILLKLLCFEIKFINCRQCFNHFSCTEMCLFWLTLIQVLKRIQPTGPGGCGRMGGGHGPWQNSEPSVNFTRNTEIH